MTDFRDFDRMDAERRMRMEPAMGYSSAWGWIAGAAFIIVILALIFAGGEGTRTTGTDASPPATTGVAPRAAPPAAPTIPPSQRP